MPNVDILCRQLSNQQKTDLTTRMTDIFTEELSCSPNDVALRFIELSPEQYAAGGRLQQNFHHYPQITPPVISEINVHWYAGKPAGMDEKVAARLTDAASEILGVAAQTVEVNFHEMHAGNHFEGGKRVSVPAPQHS